jgi:hypothetical protein
VGSGSPAKFTKPIETFSTHYSDGPMRGVLTATPLRLISQMVRNPSPAPCRNLNLPQILPLSLHVAFYVSQICPITRSTASADMKQPFGAKPDRSCLLLKP